MNSVADLVDLTIAGRLLGETALGAIDFVWPIVEFVFFLGVTIAGGTSILYSAALGSYDGDLASRRFSCGLLLTLVCGAALALILLVFQNAFFGFFGIGANMVCAVRPYWNWFLLQAVLSPVNIFLVTMVCADGGVRACTASFVAEFMVNVVSSWFLCQSYGIAGCAIGTVLGTATGIVALLPHFRSAANSLRFRWWFSLREAGRILYTDFPSSSSFLFTAWTFALMNKLLIGKFGDEALTIMAVVSIVGNFRQLLDGIPNAVQPIVGIYFTERNHLAVRRVMVDAILMTVLLGGLLSLLFMVLPQVPAKVLGVESPELLARSVSAVRIVSAAFVFMGIGSLFVPYYLFVSRPLISMLMTLVVEALGPALFCLVGIHVFGHTGFWGCYAGSFLLSSALFFLLLHLLNGRRYDLLMLPKGNEAGLVESWSDEVGERSACAIAIAVHERLEKAGASIKTIVRADMLVEDVLMTIRNRNPGRTVCAEVTLDLRRGVKLAFRDDGDVDTVKLDSVADDPVREQVMASVIRTASERNSTITCGFNRNEYTFAEEGEGARDGSSH